MGAEERTSDRRADVPVALPAVMPFEVFYRQEYRPLVALAWGLTGSRESGEDIAQEALLSLHRAWERGEQIDNPSGYVRRACANLAVSWIRRWITETRALLRLETLSRSDPMVPEDVQTFWGEVRRLPRRQAQVVALFYGYSMNVAEVSETLQISVGSTKRHLYRARHALALRLDVDESVRSIDEEVR